jgi:GNAT superfamily N-acetyltransferase
VFESNRGFHEGQVAQAVMDHLAKTEGWRVERWEPRPKRNANPDFVVVLEDWRRVGIGVREFLDPKYAQQIRYAKDRGKFVPLSTPDLMLAQEVLTDHLWKRAVLPGESVESTQILMDVRPCLLCQTQGQCLSESLLGDLGQI